MSAMKQLDMFPDLPRKEKKIEYKNCMHETLPDLMEQYGITQAQLSRATGVPTTTLSDWVNGRVKQQHAGCSLKKIADFFDVSLEYLLFGIGQDSEKESSEMLEFKIIETKKKLIKSYEKSLKFLTDTEFDDLKLCKQQVKEFEEKQN